MDNIYFREHLMRHGYEYTEIEGGESFLMGSHENKFVVCFPPNGFHNLTTGLSKATVNYFKTMTMDGDFFIFFECLDSTLSLIWIQKNFITGFSGLFSHSLETQKFAEKVATQLGYNNLSYIMEEIPIPEKYDIQQLVVQWPSVNN